MGDADGIGLLSRGPLRALVASILALAGSAIPAFLVGALGSQIRTDLGFSKTALGLAIAAFYAVPALTSVHAGVLADRVGARRTLWAAALVSAACLLSVAAFATSYLSLVIILVLGSTALAVTGPATKVLAVRHIPSRRLGTALGYQMSAVPLAALLGGAAVPAIALQHGWRWAFVGAAVLPVLSLPLLPADRDGTAHNPRKVSRRDGAVPMRPLVLLCLAATMGSAGAVTMASFFVQTGTDVGYHEGVAGAMLSVVSAAVIAFRILIGGVADHLTAGHLQVVAALFAGSAVGFMIVATDIKALFPVGAFVGLAFGWAWTAVMLHAVLGAYKQAPGLASGFVVAGLNLGSVIGPLSFGAVLDATSVTVAFVMTAAWACAAAVLTLGGALSIRVMQTSAGQLAVGS